MYGRSSDAVCNSDHKMLRVKLQLGRKTFSKRWCPRKEVRCVAAEREEKQLEENS